MDTNGKFGGNTRQVALPSCRLVGVFAMGDAVCAPYVVECAGVAKTRMPNGASKNEPSYSDWHDVRASG